MKIGKLYQNKIWLACSILLLSVLLISSVFSACAQPAAIPDEASKGFQTVQPEDVGLSSEKLNEIDTVLEADIAANKINGAVLLVARDGKIPYFKNYGYREDDKLFVTMGPPSPVLTIQDLATPPAGLGGLLFPPPGIRELYVQAGMNK